ncbi:hypothetical protein F4824DRAFT_354112 [Ustulina deusta]|nr:hypothetical protein F4824DRAFT_354112 [Ustulina deusta]
MLSWRVLSLVGWVMTSSLSTAPPTTTTPIASTPQSTACGDIVNSGDIIFNASLVYECMTSVPFNPAVATRFLAYYNDSIQFQSTLAYLKNPPPSYQQPGVDLVAGIGQLQQAINEGRFGNQYQFESALAQLIYAAHDDHLYLNAGVLAVFSFASPQDLMSISLDGISEPKVYFASDVMDSNYFTEYKPSALELINGIDSIEYLEQFATNNSFGTLEPHADWNQLMLSPVLDILGYLDVFSGGATFYPGDTVTWTFENGTTFEEAFLGLYFSQGPTGPLETGGDFYNFFVLGFYPASFLDNSGDDDGTSSSVTPTPSSSPSVTQSVATSTTPSTPNWNNSAYPPVPDVYQPDLGTLGGGFLSGYFLRSSSISVLSIPTFDEYGTATNTFQNTVQNFIDQAQAAGMTKVVIDVQGNAGGQPLLAIDAFQRFSPNISTFAGSRMRAHSAANVMGITETNFTNGPAKNDPYYEALIANEWVVTKRINAATGEYFDSWAQYYGPKSYNNDTFTNVQQYNVSDILFVNQTTGNNFVLTSQTAKTAPPWTASNIIILSDGVCGSACSLFLESMHHDAGVRVVAVGGRPKAGPMQGASGSRGAREYGIDVLDENINFVQLILNSSEANFLPNRTEANDVYITYASVNLRDQIRRNETTPLQFSYVPADCRIYFTPQTVYNYTNLWTYAADAIWNNTKLCVPGSTGHTDSDNSRTALNISDTQSPMFTLDLDNIAIPTNLPSPDELTDDNFSRRIATISLAKCLSDKTCEDPSTVCQKVRNCRTASPSFRCVPMCYGAGSQCNVGLRTGKCHATNYYRQTVGSQTVVQGWCVVSDLPACMGIGKQIIAPAPQPKI